MHSHSSTHRFQVHLKRKCKISFVYCKINIFCRDLNFVELPKARKSSLKSKEWKAGLYPVEILSSPEDGYVKVHFTGWSAKYDTIIKEAELETNECEGTQSIVNVGSMIKDSLTTGSRLDSIVRLKTPMDERDFSCLQEKLHMFKKTETKTVYSLRSRFDLNSIFGKHWDFRILNKEGDCVYIKTATVKIYHKSLRESKEFVVRKTGGQLRIEESFRPRGKQVIVSFVKCTGNYRMLPNLMDDPLL
ncbi:uncharacterized protein LOC132560904 [Ylistrum balloti]|uniref:uncharacterized protein LOC132552089 n=1 Tax=Ylistrum balloti TaxID=509963 RepID=UPI002905E295|nr:uncharacterized protein LOC132552089 [Ylistrum balloti]XP_060073389.1 uncharacterized protein LOC132553180 [Ylistrum balloti]XP_060074583.1 uncharacterized protein LOC132554295 [Ylistrum balloti]XP_060081591.1 uncharacterized protein LOC132560904 [Ylistrum balloti]